MLHKYEKSLVYFFFIFSTFNPVTMHVFCNWTVR